MYIDPNTGGMLFQILAVVFGAFSGVILLFSGKIRMFFARMRRKARGSARTEDQNQVIKEIVIDEVPGKAE